MTEWTAGELAELDQDVAQVNTALDELIAHARTIPVTKYPQSILGLYHQLESEDMPTIRALFAVAVHRLAREEPR